MTLPSTTPDPDRILREVLIDAPVARVWSHLCTADALGQWFCARLQGGPLQVGQRLRGPFTVSGCEHAEFDAWIEAVEAPYRLVWRWHPYNIEPGRDYSSEARTQVCFTLIAEGSGTRVRVEESGFAALPTQRQTDALSMNTEGWTLQLHNLHRHVESTP